MPRFREVELKIEISPDALPALKRHPLLADRPCAESHQLSVYFDTEDEALRRAGLTLRVRAKDGRFLQTVKSQTAAGGLFDRGEWEREIDSEAPDVNLLNDVPAAPRLDRKGVRGAIRPLFKTAVDRSVWRFADGRDEVELVLDQGEIIASEARAPIMEIELESMNGSSGRLFEIARDLNRLAPLRLGVLAKSERGFRLLDGSKDGVAKAGPVALSRDMTSAEGFQAIVFACIRHLRLNEPHFTGGREGDALHQVRVALRRLRSAMSLFRPVIAGDDLVSLGGELRWITSELGPARDLDVFVQRHIDPAKASPELWSQLSERRERAFDEAIAALDSHRFRTLMFSLVEWIVTGDWLRSGAAQRPLGDFAEEALERLWRKFSRRGRHLAALGDEERHELRIVAKKLRYATEFLAALYDDPKKRRARHASFVKALEDVQEKLGTLNDLVIAGGLSRKMAEGLSEDARSELLDSVESHPFVDKERLLAESATAFDALAEVRPFWR
jgi:inorganic triphosphatase YgiF